MKAWYQPSSCGCCCVPSSQDLEEALSDRPPVFVSLHIACHIFYSDCHQLYLYSEAAGPL
jgi:hypothetical protein